MSVYVVIVDCSKLTIPLHSICTYLRQITIEKQLIGLGEVTLYAIRAVCRTPTINIAVAVKSGAVLSGAQPYSMFERDLAVVNESKL